MTSVLTAPADWLFNHNLSDRLTGHAIGLRGFCSRSTREIFAPGNSNAYQASFL